MKFFERQLVTYTAWLCRTFGVTQRQINKVRDGNCDSFVPRPEGALGNLW
jgi:hypothetical protein